MECVRPCHSTCCQTDGTPSLLVLLHTGHDYPMPASCHCYFSSSRMHAAIMPRGVAPPNNPLVGCRRLAAVRRIAKCADMFPLVSDYPHICFLLDLQQLLLLLPLLLSRSAHGHAVRLEIPHPLRTARVPTIVLPSRCFGCCTPKTTSSPRHHLRDFPPSQARPPAVMRTSCSRVPSHHTFRRALR